MRVRKCACDRFREQARYIKNKIRGDSSMYMCGVLQVWVPRSGAERHISSEITTRRHAAYLDDKQHRRDLSATQQIR